MGDYKIRDINLADKGELQIEWASDHMPVLSKIKERFSKEKPLAGSKIGACLHATKETAVLVRTLEAGGAQVFLCGSNPLSTQDEVVAALAKNGTSVYAWRGETTEEYYWCINKVLENDLDLTMDDGADLVSTIHSKQLRLLEKIKGGSEETTTGVIRLRAMASEKALRYPIVAVNDAYTKYLFDNRYGSGQSTVDGILRSTSVLLAGKRFVVCGYGWVGRGIAIRAKGMGADVIVTEVDPLKALEAVMDGFRVMPLKEASKIGDIFVTATGNINVIDGGHIQLMKSGAILANSGHFNVEINIPALEKMAKSKRLVRVNMEEYKLNDGRSIYLLAEGRLVNLAAAEGHPSEVMDLSFADQALVAEYLWTSERLEPQVYRVPEEIDSMVANLKLKSMGVDIDVLTEEQKNYIKSWREGTI